MTIRLFLTPAYSVATWVLFFVGLADSKHRNTWLLVAIWIALLAINQTLGAIALHTGAYPLWNNK